MNAFEAISFRPYTPADLDAIFQLDRVCFESPFRFSRLAMRRFAEARNALVLLAHLGAMLSGFVLVHVEGQTAYIVTLDVARDSRRRGLASALMASAETAARAAHCSEMALHVFVENASAIRLYERLHYRRERLQTGFYGRGLDAWIYGKPL